ncbi:MAG: PTS transporter subunit EIIC, partial [Tissierella sp.]|uniref:PTS transporter subunit EIIC n=1 Tax=Tissierella sp. TaxID=41274 RepID=UPI003F99AF25
MSKENNLNNRKAGIMQKITKTLGDIFIPIIPVLVATGLFIGLRGFVINLGYQLNPNVELFSEILTDIVFMFLPVLVSWSTVKAFGGRPVVGIVLGLMLVAPQLPSAWDVGKGLEPLK